MKYLVTSLLLSCWFITQFSLESYGQECNFKVLAVDTSSFRFYNYLLLQNFEEDTLKVIVRKDNQQKIYIPGDRVVAELSRVKQVQVEENLWLRRSKDLFTFNGRDILSIDEILYCIEPCE